MPKYLFLVAAVTLFTVTGCGDSADANKPAELKVKDPEAIDVAKMISNLSNNNLKSRALSAYLLGEAGERATEALPALEKLAARPEGPDQAAAVAAIEKIKNPKPPAE